MILTSMIWFFNQYAQHTQLSSHSSTKTFLPLDRITKRDQLNIVFDVIVKSVCRMNGDDAPNETYYKPRVVKTALKYLRKGVSQGEQNKIGENSQTSE